MVRNQGEKAFDRGKNLGFRIAQCVVDPICIVPRSFHFSIRCDDHLNVTLLYESFVEPLPGEVNVRLNTLAPLISVAVEVVAPVITIVL